MNHNVVFHFDHDTQALEIAVSNIRNYYSAFDAAPPSVVLVANGPGVKHLLRTGEYAGTISELARLGAEIKVCNNALNHLGIAPGSLCPECVVVSAGVVEIVELQEKGYAYVKP